MIRRYSLWLLLLCSSFQLVSQSSQSRFVHFDVDAYELSITAQSELQTLLTDLETHSDYTIDIVGHTDQDGSDVYNQALAAKRANAVKEYLLALGAPEVKLSADWKGEQQLADNRATKSAKKKNRRVELRYRTYDFTDVEDFVANVTEDPALQTYTCSQQSQFFDLRNGTSVYIPEAAFEFADGSTPAGDVQLEMIEAFSFTDIVSNNLVTTCKDELLETGGMVYISASSEGKPLQLKEGKQLEFIFPLQRTEEGMELFYGEADEAGNIVWNETEENVRTTQVKNNPLDVDFTPIIEYDFGEIVKPTITFEDMPRRPKRLEKPYPPSKHTYIGEKYEEMYKSYEENLAEYNAQLPLLEKAEKEWQAEVTKRLWAIDDFKKQITEFQYSRKLFSAVRGLKQMEGRRAPVEVLTNLFSFINRPFPVKLDQRITFKKAFGNYTKEIVDERKLEVYQKEHMTTVGRNYYPELKALIFDAKRLAQEEAFARTGTMEESEFSSYIMGISELGWINCDRFRREEQLTKLTVLEAHETTKYYMIFKDIRSIIQAKRLKDKGVFNNIPLGREVKLVAVKLVDNKPMMAMQDYTIAEDDALSLTFYPSSLSQIRKELNSLDPMFEPEDKVEPAQEPSITMFPNPTSTDFTLEVDSDVELQSVAVYNLSGALVKDIDQNEKRISVADMDSGVYLVNARFADGAMTSERIVVQH